MISIKSGAYSKAEKRMLAEALEKAESLVMHYGCDGGEHLNCKSCPYRHICNDLSSAREHAEALAYK